MQQIETHSALSDSTSISTDFFHRTESLRGRHERQREFCTQLGILANDIWQLGHEKLAMALLETATIDIANDLEGQSELFASALRRCGASQAETEKVATEMVCRRHSVATRATSTIDGLDRLASGEMPPVPMHFILSALRLVGVLSRNIDWEEDVLLPLVESEPTGADRRGLDSATAGRRRGARNGGAYSSAQGVPVPLALSSGAIRDDNSG